MRMWRVSIPVSNKDHSRSVFSWSYRVLDAGFYIFFKVILLAVLLDMNEVQNLHVGESLKRQIHVNFFRVAIVQTDK